MRLPNLNFIIFVFASLRYHDQRYTISKSSTVFITIHDSRGRSVVSPSQLDVPSSTILWNSAYLYMLQLLQFVIYLHLQETNGDFLKKLTLIDR